MQKCYDDCIHGKGNLCCTSCSEECPDRCSDGAYGKKPKCEDWEEEDDR